MTRRTSYPGEWIFWVLISVSCLSQHCHQEIFDTDSRTSPCCNDHGCLARMMMTRIQNCWMTRMMTRKTPWIWMRRLISAAASLYWSVVFFPQAPLVFDEQVEQQSDHSAVSLAYTGSPGGWSGCLGSWSRNHNYHRQVSGSPGWGQSYIGLSRRRQLSCSVTWKWTDSDLNAHSGVNLYLIMTLPSRHVSVILCPQFLFYCWINLSGKLRHCVTHFRDSHTIFTESIMHCTYRFYWYMTFSAHFLRTALLFWLSQRAMWPESLLVSDWAERDTGAWVGGRHRQSKLQAGALLPFFGRTLVPSD